MGHATGGQAKLIALYVDRGLAEQRVHDSLQDDIDDIDDLAQALLGILRRKYQLWGPRTPISFAKSACSTLGQHVDPHVRNEPFGRQL